MNEGIFTAGFAAGAVMAGCGTGGGAICGVGGATREVRGSTCETDGVTGDAGGGVNGGAADVTASGTFWPHFVQNLSPGANGCPHFVQNAIII